MLPISHLVCFHGSRWLIWWTSSWTCVFQASSMLEYHNHLNGVPNSWQRMNIDMFQQRSKDRTVMIVQSGRILGYPPSTVGPVRSVVWITGFWTEMVVQDAIILHWCFFFRSFYFSLVFGFHVSLSNFRIFMWCLNRGEKKYYFWVMACLCRTIGFITSSRKSCGLLSTRSQRTGWPFLFFFPCSFSNWPCRLFSLWNACFLNESASYRATWFQVAASMQKETDGIPNYPSLPSKLICVLLNVTLHVWKILHMTFVPCLPFFSYEILNSCFNQADTETDEVYAQMTLQPVNKVFD